MEEKNIELRKRREMGDVISDSFIFLKQEGRQLFQLSLTYVLPFIIIYAVVQVLVQQKLMGALDMSDPESIIGNLGPIYTNIFITMFFNLFVQSLYIGAIYSYIEVYAEKGKGNFTLQDITPSLFSNSLMVLGINFVIFIIVMLGAILCIIPGIYFMNTLSIAIIVLIMEKKGLNHALAKSWKLVNTQWWNTFGINVLGIIIIMTVGFILSLPSVITGFSTSIMQMQDLSSPIEFPQWYWILLGVNTVISSLLYIISYVFLAFQYFNLEERVKDSVNV